ncbi:phosphoribosylanthranilate isomerase [Pseudactinotalea sp. HY158]|uniref:phosphoribosylanthranilate isomerase n=1 Tax=Pseudactinotalea sp. HY158 TaxID=2654547 RepID=UPI00129C8A99|nr:phosphoribosylanthranilate isomerase [Pseudactinotalea sp. HY158]QGH70172.1 phosphoribosylanthranilate isomerase [Pseudactinotalea sp. HY158]
MYVKICGLSTPATLAAAVAAGADAVGFVFAPGSPRTITPEIAAPLVAAAGPSVETVGVFRDQPIEEVLALARAAGVSTVQLHGREDDAAHLRVIEAGFAGLRAFSAEDYLRLSPERIARWATRRILLDAVRPGAGETFDAALLEEARPAGFWLLAGGLTPANVAGLVARLRPSGVDVSSGVESSRGVKSARLITEFVAAARAGA